MEIEELVEVVEEVEEVEEEEPVRAILMALGCGCEGMLEVGEV